MSYSEEDKQSFLDPLAQPGIESASIIEPRPTRGFVQTDEVKELTSRALNYLRAGFPIHLRGPTGVGKTTLALHIARKLRQSVVLIHGDDQFTTKDLTGRSHGYSYKKVIDQFVRGVSKTEERMTKDWLDHRLTLAAKNGYTLIYDEFSRSRPEANNIFLSILQEGILDFPIDRAGGEAYLKVHPNFKAIFTSNPDEYAGVHSAQDALLDRMITLDLGHYDRETEIKITAAKSRLSQDDAEKIVIIARELRGLSKNGYLPTVRGCIMVGKSTKKKRGAEIMKTSLSFRQICHDVFISEMIRNEDKEKKEVLAQTLNQLIDKHCPVPSRFFALFNPFTKTKKQKQKNDQ